MKNDFKRRGAPATPPQPESDNESWIIQFDPKTFTPARRSPRLLRLTPSHTSSPKHIEPRPHRHMLRSFAGISKPIIAKGRQRNLTELEKSQAREVREAKACWACHISKTKCSPCSPGTPCQQCARLVGKRRFCRFDCFNDPLESLYVFLAPEYIFEHFTRQNVEAFVARNTKSWGQKSFPIRISWGSSRKLQAEVVTLELRGGRSEMAFEYTTEALGPGWKQNMVRKKSPPLGIPIAAMDDMPDAYNVYVRTIVESDLPEYVNIGYFEQDSTLAKRLLAIAGYFYATSAEAGQEFEVLRQALEIHVTAKILEKSLTLDAESSSDVQNRFQTEYPEKPVARCVQRQIKLAFFLNQQQLINNVLKEWGTLMWTLNPAGNDSKWAVTFSVFLVLTLVMDKVSASAHYYCEDKILHQGSGPDAEKAAFLRLVRLTETQLFDRCKEIFHWKFKTRKCGKESCNPIRDGMDAFRGRPVSSAIANLTLGLQDVIQEFGNEVRSHRTVSRERLSSLGLSPYADTGRLAAILLDDFLEH
ncbi:hypothetical protein BJ875DRAFT_379195 [Amylocarpus encephaloides]|uniref:Uncharacterized protein n=1 Tax=Amylocarpus encephaloides TaxID=45428 RepID=A0A9P8C4H6_9HELO|nr:hypothetical protein BJ875DRAFT_379195 [Amylocarpus encephaloides]